MELKNFNGDQLRPDWQREMNQFELDYADRLLNDALSNQHDEDKIRAWNAWSDSWVFASKALKEQAKREGK